MNTTSSDLAKQSEDFIDKTADKVNGGIRNARQTANKLGETAAARAQTILSRGMDSAKATAQQVRDGATQASESIVTYTKENPVKAIFVAAATGALLVTLFKALSRFRD